MAEIVKLPLTDFAVLDHAVNTLLNGGVVLFPTETVYGIGADIRCPAAIQRLYEIKKRPYQQSCLIHCSTLDQATPYVKRIPAFAHLLAQKFLPGPLALILLSSSKTPAIVSAGTNTVGIRVVNNPVFREIVFRLGAPLVGTSANRHGQPATNDFNALDPEIITQVDIAIDAGKIGSGNPSTIIDLTTSQPRLLREGDIKKQELEQTLGLKLAP
ncbi:MAG: threonylcarbamoyl-AMP synthase [candidate division WOR-3 bacterium]|jgi:L-threonylcarbamoyladenylate synthase|nr:threonylcarbamoyl-AMP synthase [candidate division WOR-3 bacterium]MCR4423034.1 L-threonylcarbamoyladenylate synthase [candidate division WOR-3 bacterium]MDH7518373.1 L-threonylcarbamoyladenylate synthase [bacterium]